MKHKLVRLDESEDVSMSESQTTVQSEVAQKAHQQFMQLSDQLKQHIVGQSVFLDKMLIALLANGHLIVEGLPGLAKTRAIKVLAQSIEGDFHRIQFTPDLLPADITGTDIFRPQDGSFVFQRGPIFNHFVLADEINRAPAKVQSALLEAMAENQVSVGQNTYALPQLFLVMATQNPIEQTGTYPLPEAQLDRFVMCVKLNYPEAQEERAILNMGRAQALKMNEQAVRPCMSQQTVFAARAAMMDVHLSEALEQYLIQLVLATRDAAPYCKQLASFIEYGASPRATIALDVCARAHAWLAKRDYITPEDIHAVFLDVLRHRLVLSMTARAQGKTSDEVLTQLLAKVPVP
jgi:MoxR-like ATPase